MFENDYNTDSISKRKAASPRSARLSSFTYPVYSEFHPFEFYIYYLYTFRFPICHTNHRAYLFL